MLYPQMRDITLFNRENNFGKWTQKPLLFSAISKKLLTEQNLVATQLFCKDDENVQYRLLHPSVIVKQAQFHQSIGFHVTGLCE